MPKGDDIQARMVKLVVALVKICDELPESRAAGHIASQPLRSGTSPAPNHAEARGAESDKDFVHKLKVVLRRAQRKSGLVGSHRRRAVASKEQPGDNTH